LDAVLRGYQAVEVVYHAYLTGLILATASRRGREDAAALVFTLPEAVFEIWNELWVGALSVHNRRLRLETTHRRDAGSGGFEWRIRPRP